MATGKPINKSYYASGQTGAPSDIEMPPMDETSPITNAAPNPWDQQPEQSAVAEVPEQVSVEVEEEQPVEQEPEESQQQAPRRNSDKEENMRYMREAREKAERERDELLKMVMQQQIKQQPKQQEVEPEELDFDIDPESLVEGKNLKKVIAKIKYLEQQQRDSQKRNVEQLAEARVKAQYSDFDKVVNDDNLRALKDMHPEVAQTLLDTKDVYSQFSSAYKLIKAFGIHRDESTERDYMKAIKNVNKPKPLASVNPQQGDSPLSKANAFANGEFTQEMKEKLRREMFESRKRL